MNQSNNVPVDFNWLSHQSLHPDNTQPGAIKHVVHQYHNKSHGVPDDFDWIAYRSLNPDLSHIVSYKDAVKHYKMHGFRQSRPYKFGTLTEQVVVNNPNKKHQTDSKWIEYNFIKSDIDLNQLKELHGATYSYMNKNYDMPEDFDWLAYRSLNPDLTQIKSYQDAVRHYKEHGYREGRQYRHGDKKNPETSNNTNNVISSEQKISFDDIPYDFDWLAYKTFNPDLKHIASLQDAARHYRDHGKREGRSYKNPGVPVQTEISHLEKVQIDYDWITFRPYKSSGNAPNNEQEQSFIGLIPHDFDWVAYKSLNTDLSYIKSFQDAAKHYRDHGHRESRPYKYHMEIEKPVGKPSQILRKMSMDGVPVDFNWLEYRSLHPDLKHISTYQEAVQHYCEHGKREGRAYKLPEGTAKPISAINIIPSDQPMVVRQNRPQIIVPPPIKIPVQQQIEKPVIVDSQARMAKQVSEMTKQLPPLNRPKAKMLENAHPKIVSTNKPSDGLIPNIIHFVYGFKEQTEEFELFKYIAIKSAIDLNKPEKVYFYYKYEPFGPWWNKIKPFLTLEYVEPPNEIFGNKLTHFAHKSDVVRLRSINERGGIYLDIDTICLRPLTEFLKYDFVMGIQGNDYGLCNAIMMAKPGTEFGKQWYEAYKSFNCKDWDYHSVILPLKLAKQIPITILSNDALFYPLWDPIGNIVFNDNLNLDECRKIFSNSYCIHLWESWSLQRLREVNENSIFQYNSLYNIIARKFIKNTFSIVMLTYNRSQKTIDCIQSFYKALDRPDIEEFLILDNNSQEPELLEFLKNLPNINKKIRVINSTENLGVCGGRLVLFEQAKGDLICSVDSDLSLIDCKFFDIVKEALFDESIGMVGASGAYFSKSFKFDSHKDVIDSENNMKIDSLAGCCQVFRNDLKYFKVKLDYNYGKFWVEDADFSFQIRLLGKNLLLIPQKNLVDHTWGGSGSAFADLFKKNWDYFTKKWKSYDYLCSQN